jgi:hypothetical protein
MKGINLVIAGDVNMSARRNPGGAVKMRACHQLVWAPSIENNCAGISIITVQSLIA